MQNEYSKMDEWSDEKIVLYKERGEELSAEKNGDGEMLVSEGDSWFDYRAGADLIDFLRNEYRYRIKNYAKGGDTLENMIYGTEINDDFERTTPTIQKVLRKIRKVKPKVFLFSGGGNDIAGDEFASFLNHSDSRLPVLRVEYIEKMIDVVFQKYFRDLIAKVASVSPETHIVTHGYAHTVPTGKGVKLVFITFAGPWLRPALAMKGIMDPVDQRNAVDHMIDKYNQMLGRLDTAKNNFHHVDLRKTIDPEKDWENELHLKNSAFARAADQMHLRIQDILSG